MRTVHMIRAVHVSGVIHTCWYGMVWVYALFSRCSSPRIVLFEMHNAKKYWGYKQFFATCKQKHFVQIPQKFPRSLKKTGKVVGKNSCRTNPCGHFPMTPATPGGAARCTPDLFFVFRRVSSMLSGKQCGNYHCADHPP